MTYGRTENRSACGGDCGRELGRRGSNTLRGTGRLVPTGSGSTFTPRRPSGPFQRNSRVRDWDARRVPFRTSPTFCGSEPVPASSPLSNRGATDHKGGSVVRAPRPVGSEETTTIPSSAFGTELDEKERWG